MDMSKSFKENVCELLGVPPDTTDEAVLVAVAQLCEAVNGPVYEGHPVRWSELPAEVQFVAMDSTGWVCGYRNRPRQGMSVWVNGDDEVGKLFEFDDVDAPAVDWRESLRKRPGA